MIDSDGFRPNVGIILTNDVGQVLWARRVNQDAWQFPQGGINDRETPEEALFRELNEEVGLEEQDVKILACTRGWLRYRLPQRLVRTHSQPLCIGQKQKWFLLRLTGDERIARCAEHARGQCPRDLALLDDYLLDLAAPVGDHFTNLAERGAVRGHHRHARRDAGHSLPCRRCRTCDG